nr:MAG TPA: hypothetical protein [Caudoviricetes sp.]
MTRRRLMMLKKSSGGLPEGLYGIEIYSVVGHSVYRHRTQADAGF